MRRATAHQRLIIFLILSLAIPRLFLPVYAIQNTQSRDKIWRILDENKVTISATVFTDLKQVILKNAVFVTLDQQRLNKILTPPTRPAGPVLTTSSSVPQQTAFFEITLPLPDKTFARFLIQESSIMEPELEQQFPDFKSYRGQGIDDPTMTLRASQTPAGFHAIVLSSDRTFYIDPFPLRKSDTETHVTFFKRDYPDDVKRLRCFVREDAEGPAILSRRANRAAPLSNGDTLRTYRLAVAATGEYTKFHGGKKEAFQAIFTTINRVNAIYENDLAISLRLVGDETNIIYTDADKDPYSNSDAFKLLSENQRNLDEVLGPGNYDIGHVFCVGGGGVATLRSVGQNGLKAEGATGSEKPVGDAFDVDYVAHEMGHQFGANHTFNATTQSCGSGNRNPTTAYEPGSGSTIMAYAGICGESDLQANSHSYFHGASLEEIIGYVTSDPVKSVPKVTLTNNHPPSVVAGQNFTIPKGTPFTLRAVGTDLDGDAITYSWEQFDLGEPSPPDDDIAVSRPLFRSFNPLRESVRFFPRMENLVSGRTTIGESLPARQRSMSFRVIVRDNRAGGGGFSYATANVSVVTDSGPFVVTRPDSATTWKIGTSQVITWDVARTKDAPVNCGNVKISLSLDGGKTFSVLQAVAPNTGTATITVPNKPTAQARIMVEGLDQAFFNISQGDFKIVS